MMNTQPFCMDPALPHPPPGEPDTGGVAEAATINAAVDLVADAFRFGGKLGVLRAVGTEVSKQLQVSGNPSPSRRNTILDYYPHSPCKKAFNDYGVGCYGVGGAAVR